MTDKIQIAYSWIGPKGPIINTELPNIFMFAGVAEKTRVESNFYWADNVWHEIFVNHDNYVLSAASQLGDTDMFIYPYTIPWRVPLQNYLLYGSGLLEFSQTPEHIIHHVKCSNGYFLIDISAEAFVQPNYLDLFYSYFSHYHQIPMKKIIYLTGCMNAVDLHDNYCNVNGIDKDERMILIPYPTSYEGYARSIRYEKNYSVPEYDINQVPEKLFLVWNRRYRRHRTGLAVFLEKMNLIERSYISMGKTDPENNSVVFEKTYDEHLVGPTGVTRDHLESLVNKLPLVIDGETNIHQMCLDEGSTARNFYTNSLVSIVTETNWDLNEVTCTEKSFKPMKEKHPFIMMGAALTLKSLRDLGFKTFGDIWDESYDFELNSNIRFRKIAALITEISNWDNEKILDFKRKAKPIVDHNYNLLRKSPVKHIANTLADIILSKRIDKNIINTNEGPLMP